jgi:predicted membrane chloride channel (bestrophin family)
MHGYVETSHPPAHVAKFNTFMIQCVSFHFGLDCTLTKRTTAVRMSIFNQGRAIDTFLVPLSISTVNSIIWTLLIKFPFQNSFKIQEEPWGSIYTLVLTTSLAFMLVFRLNRVAIRWWDTRAMWGSIITNTRVLTSAIVEHCNHDPESRD